MIYDNAFERCYKLDIENLLTVKEIESDAFGKYANECPINLLKEDLSERAKYFKEKLLTASNAKKLKEKLDKSDLKKEYDTIITNYDNFSINWNAKSIYLADTITDLGKMKFGYYSSIQKIKLPKDIRIIPNAIFWGCRKLKELEISDNVLVIEKKVFSDCIKLEKIYIPETVKLISTDIFNNCKSLKQVKFGEDTISLEDFLSRYPVYDDNQFLFHEKVLLNENLQQFKNSKFDEKNISQSEKIYNLQLDSLSPLLKLLKNVNKTQLEKTLGYRVTSWKEKSRPPFEKIVDIAKYFDVDCKNLFTIATNKKISESTILEISVKTKSTNIPSDSINPMIYDFMKTHQRGHPYPEEIKLAVVSEYIPLIYGYEKIGKKYGVNTDMIKDWVKQYSPLSNTKTNYLKSDSIELKEDLNPTICEFIATHKKGDPYPEEIRIAVASEYIPLIYGYERIGKKYGIDPDTVKKWVATYRNDVKK